MFNPFQGATDDQMALMGCLIALVSSVGLMYVSFYVGPAGRKKGRHLQSADPTLVSIEMPAKVSRDRAA